MVGSVDMVAIEVKGRVSGVPLCDFVGGCLVLIVGGGKDGSVGCESRQSALSIC